jgi:hypothetical protein
LALSCKVGSFSSGTGALSSTVAVTGVGFQPLLVIFWWSGRTDTTDAAGSATHRRGFGYASTTSVRGCVFSQSTDAGASSDTDSGTRTDACVAVAEAAGVSGLLDLSSMDSDGFTLVVDDVMPDSVRIHYMALGGADLTTVTAGFLTEPGATGDQDITVTGFRPSAPDQCVLFFGAGSTVADPPNFNNDSRVFFGAAAEASPVNYVWSGGSNAGDATMQTISYCRAGECIAELDASAVTAPDGRASVTTWLTDAYRLNWTERASTRRILWVALKGGSYKLGDLLTQTDTTTDIVETGFGFTPKGALFLSHGKVASTVNVAQAHDEWSQGAYDGTNQRAHAVHDEDNTLNAEVATAVEHDNVVVKMTASDTVESAMQALSLDAEGLTCEMTDAAASQYFVWYLAVGDAGGVPYCIAAGAGVSGTGTLAVPQVAAPAGTYARLQVLVRAGSGQTPDTPSGWSLEAGPHTSTSSTARQWVFREDTARTGSESGDLSVTFAAGSAQKTARMYAFANDSGAAVEDVDVTLSTTATVTMPAVTAAGIRRLAVAFVGADDDNAIAAGTGATGGTWTEPVAEYLGGTTTMVQLQTAALPAGGTISGGSAVMANDDETIVTSFAIVGTGLGGDEPGDGAIAAALTASGVSAALSASAGAASAAATPAGVSAALAASAGSISGALTVSGAGQAAFAGAGAIPAALDAAGASSALAASAGSVACTASVSGTSSALAASAGTVSCEAVALGTSDATAASVGSIAGVLTASGAGQSAYAGDGTASASLVAAGVSSALAASAGSVSAILTPAAAGSSLAAGAGAIALASTAAGTSAATAASVGAISAACTVDGVGDFSAEGAGAGAIASVAAITGVSSALAASVGASGATLTAEGISGQASAGAGTASASLTVSGAGASLVAGAGAISVSCSVTATGTGAIGGAGAVVIASTVTGGAAALASAAGSIAGVATCAATSSALASSAGAIACALTVSGVGITETPPDPPILTSASTLDPAAPTASGFSVLDPAAPTATISQAEALVLAA